MDLLAYGPEELPHRRERRGPLTYVALLRAWVEGNSVRLEAEADGGLDELAHEVGMAAEFLGQRPIRAEAVGEEPEAYLRAGGRVGDHVEVRNRIGRVETDSALVKVRYVPFLLDRVPEAHAVRRDAQGDQLVELEAAGDVEAGTHVAEEGQDPFLGIRLYRVINLGEG